MSRDVVITKRIEWGRVGGWLFCERGKMGFVYMIGAQFMHIVVLFVVCVLFYL